MASIRREFLIDARPEEVWDAVHLDDERRRLVWTATGGRLTHHNASAQVFAAGDKTRFVWTADLLPNEMAAPIAAMIDAGCAAMKKALERK